MSAFSFNGGMWVTDEALDWQSKGLCAQTDPEMFFPEKGASTTDAKRTCMSCEVRVECLTYALEHDERFGVWGGMTEHERRKAKRKARETGQPLDATLAASVTRLPGQRPQTAQENPHAKSA